MYRLKPFGVLNGREVPVIELFSDKCAVELLPYGAAVRANPRAGPNRQTDGHLPWI